MVCWKFLNGASINPSVPGNSETIESPASRGEHASKTPDEHLYIDLFIRGQDHRINSVKFSLPGILHGFNGIQIKRIEEYQLAIEKARSILSSICGHQVTFGQIRRFDFAYNIPCDPQYFLRAFRIARHPWITKDSCQYRNNSTQLMGKNYTFSIYDKTHQRQNKAGFPHDGPLPIGGKSLRIELQAKTKNAVRRLYGTRPEEPVYIIDPVQAWGAFRDAFLIFPIATVPATKCSEKALIALCERSGVTLPDGTPVYDWWAIGKDRETIRKARRQIISYSFPSEGFDLKQLLPERWPTRFIDVHRNGSEHEVCL